MMRDDDFRVTLARLAETLVVGYDTVDLLQTIAESCADLLGVDDAAFLLTTRQTELELIAATNESGRFAERIDVAAGTSHVAEAVASGEIVSSGPLTVIPLRLASSNVGILVLFSDANPVLEHGELEAARTLADIATVGVLHERTLRESALLVEQLESALQSRIVIERWSPATCESARRRRRARDQGRARRLRIAGGDQPPPRL
jgi:hypothetical protein